MRLQTLRPLSWNRNDCGRDAKGGVSLPSSSLGTLVGLQKERRVDGGALDGVVVAPAEEEGLPPVGPIVLLEVGRQGPPQ